MDDKKDDKKKDPFVRLVDFLIMIGVILLIPDLITRFIKFGVALFGW